MFGKKNPRNNPPEPPRLSASDVARIQGGGLVQIVVTRLRPVEFFLFLNDEFIPQQDIESFSLSIESPTKENLGGIVRATLSRYAQNVTGARANQRTELFPCTIEIIAVGRRLSITALQPDSVDGLWISLGLRADGTNADITGAQALRVLIMDGFVDAKLTWNDGETEDLFPIDPLGL